MTPPTPRNFTTLLATLALAVAASACNDAGNLTGPDGTLPSTLLSAQIPFEDLTETVDQQGPARVEIKLLPGQLVAREVELEENEDLDDHEDIRSKVTAISTGSVTLAIGGLVVGFDETTRLRIDDIGDVLADQFVAWVQNEIDQGRELWVRARRPAPVEPQAPEDGSFFATRLRIREDRKEARIKINIDEDNLRTNTESDSPDGWIDVLGLEIEIRQSEGITEVEDEMRDEEDDDDEDNEFEGMVASADAGSMTFTLASGAGFFLDQNSLVEQDGDLLTLQAVADALAAGTAVEAEGDADVEPNEAGQHRVIRVKFETDEDHDQDDDNGS